jgi:hypothetical protein
MGADAKVNDLSLRQLQDWQDGMIQRDDEDPDRERRSRDTSNRVLSALKACLNFVYDNRKETGVISRDEWGRSFKMFKGVRAERTHRFGVEDVQQLIHAAEKGPEPAFADVIKALFYLSGRPVASCRLSMASRSRSFWVGVDINITYRDPRGSIGRKSRLWKKYDLMVDHAGSAVLVAAG